MEIGSEVITGVGTGGTVLAIGYAYVKAQLAKVTELSERMIKLETKYEDKLRECERYHGEIECRFSKGDNAFAEFAQRMAEMNQILHQILGFIKSTQATSTRTDTQHNIPRMKMDHL